jgi:hypothetical protein
MTDDDKKKHAQLAREVIRIAAPAFAFVRSLTPIKEAGMNKALEHIKK